MSHISATSTYIALRQPWNCPQVLRSNRVITVWRALWSKMVAMKACQGKDPSLSFADSQPQPRSEVWQHREVLRLVQRAWREEYHGLAAVIAVAWDTMLSPVDVRRLSPAQRRDDGRGVWFKLGRAKTGMPAIGTLSRWSERILNVYPEKLPAKPVGTTPLFWSRGLKPCETGGRPWPPRPYTKDRLSRLMFGAHDNRQLADMRRSGAVEATAGDAKVEKLVGKIANTIHSSRDFRRPTNRPRSRLCATSTRLAKRRGGDRKSRLERNGLPTILSQSSPRIVTKTDP
jgi:hypothetical protein